MANKVKLGIVAEGGNGVTPSPSVPADGFDISSLYINQALGDTLTATYSTSIEVGRPKNFFRLAPPTHRREVEVYTHKIEEGGIGTETYLLAPAMQGQMTEAGPCTLAAYILRDGTIGLWPLKHPRSKGFQQKVDAAASARAVARAAVNQWVKPVWQVQGNRYIVRESDEGYAPDPDFATLPPFDELVRAAFGQYGIIRDKSHPVYRALYGKVMEPGEAEADEGDL